MLVDVLKTSADFEREMHSTENRQMAEAMATRLLKFLEQWSEGYDRKSGNALDAMHEAKALLPAIGAKILAIPQANRDKDGKLSRYRYMLALENGLRWQNVRIEAETDALFATLTGIIETIRDVSIALPDVPVSEEDIHLYGHSPEFYAYQGRGLLIHALQHRIALETKDNPQVPIAITPLAARSIRVVAQSRTRKDWLNADKTSGFWYYGKDDYNSHDTQGTIAEALEKLADVTSKTRDELINYILDWNVVVESGGDTNVHIVQSEYKVTAAIHTWFRSDISTYASYSPTQIYLNNPALPESAMYGMTGKSGKLDDLIDHWVTRDTGVTVTGSRVEKNHMQGRQLILDIEESPAEIIFMPWNKEALAIEKLENPLTLQKTHSS